MPVGSPSAPLTILPPGGSGVSRVIRAARNAAVFRTWTCREAYCQLKTTGRSAAAASSSARVGSRRSRSRVRSMRGIWIHCAAGVDSALFRTHC